MQGMQARTGANHIGNSIKNPQEFFQRAAEGQQKAVNIHTHIGEGVCKLGDSAGGSQQHIRAEYAQQFHFVTLHAFPRVPQ